MEAIMKIDDVIAYMLRGRIIDLSKKAVPGGAEGPGTTGQRKYEIRPFTFPPGEIMHEIEMENHISTHIEAPSHWVPARHGRSAKDVSELPLTTFFGSAVLVDCKDIEPKTGIGPAMLEGFQIQASDIVLLGKSPHQGDDTCYLSKEGAEYLLEQKIKMLGVDDTICPENTEYVMKDMEQYFTHDLMLCNDIPLIEGLVNLEALKTQRFLFLAFPAKLGGLDSFPIRALAIEENE
jgi:kynurenine formamidase